MTSLDLGAVGQLDATRRRRRRHLRERSALIVRSVLMWALALLFLMPFVWMISSSLKRDIDVFNIPIEWIPTDFRWENYVKVWSGAQSMVGYFINSGIVLLARLVGQIALAVTAGYAFGRLQFRGKNVLFLVLLATMIVPAQLLLVPRFMFFRELGLYDTLWAVILPFLASVFGIFLFRQHFASAPHELGEAARLDGASEFRIFWSVYLPMAKPMVVAYAILVFDSSWNDYETPLVMLSSDSNYTVPLGLTQFSASDGTISSALLMAGSVSSIIPLLVFFVLFQRHFLQSMARAGLR